MCSGRSSEWNVEVLEGGGEEDLEERGEEVVEDVLLVIRGWERWLREWRCEWRPAALCMISVTPSHCDNVGQVVVAAQGGYLNIVS